MVESGKVKVKGRKDKQAQVSLKDERGNCEYRTDCSHSPVNQHMRLC